MIQLPVSEDFSFRAHRSYVHSASLCNFLVARFPECRRIELVMKSWMDSRLVFTPVDAVRPGQGSGYAKLALKHQELILELSQDKAYPVTNREPYDEDALAQGGTIEGRRFLCPPGNAGSFFDRLVAANKALINACLDPGVKLIAAKIVVEGQPSSQTPFALDLISHTGTRIFKSSLLIDGKKAGEVIYYGQ